MAVPVVQTAALTQELNIVNAMVEAGRMPPSKMVEDYFGITFEDPVHRSATDKARAQVLGHVTMDAGWSAESDVAKSILAEVEGEEGFERKLVDEAEGDDSVLLEKNAITRLLS